MYLRQGLQVAGVSVMQAKISALEKELEAEKSCTVSLTTRLQNEARQKRRLEDEYALLENRRVLRQNFVGTPSCSFPCCRALPCTLTLKVCVPFAAQALKPSRMIEGPQHVRGSGARAAIGRGSSHMM